MKRFLSVILCFLILMPMLLSACDNSTGADPTGTALGSEQGTTAATTSATTTATTTQKQEEEKSPYEIRDIASKLISNWDFKGATDEERLTDKSTLGKSAEKITLSGENAKVEDGKLTVLDGANYAAIDCAQNTDFYDLMNKTLVVRAKIINNENNGVANRMSTLLSKKSTYGIEFQKATSNRAGRLVHSVTGTEVKLDHGYKYTASEWRVHAIVVDVNLETGEGTIKVYVSTVEDPTSYKDFEEVTSVSLKGIKENAMKGTDKLYLGKRYNQLNDFRTLDSEFALIQLYDMPLNLGEIASINTSGSLIYELKSLIAKAEAVKKDDVRGDYAWNSLLASIEAAKKITANNSVQEIKAACDDLNEKLSLLIINDVANTIGNLSLMPYNNPDLDVPIQAGKHSNPGLYDIDGDGDMDLIWSGQSRSYGGVPGGGLFAYRNVSDVKGTTSLGHAELLQYDAKLPYYSYRTDGSSVFVDEGGVMYTKITNNGFEDPKTFSKLTDRFKVYDIDGDGLSDAVYVKTTSTGESAYDKNGNWLRKQTTTLCWIKNTGTEQEPIYSTSERSIRNREGTTFIVKDDTLYEFIRTFSMFDWDKDGDLDLIAGGKLNEYYYYENIGTNKNPVFDNSGVKIETVSGPLKLDVCLFNIINYDWDGDGYDDIMIGSESGTTEYFRFTGRFNPVTKAPIFEDGKFFTQKAEYLAVNALSRPSACDFDNDGDIDFIVGDNCGYIWFYENLTGGANPSWAAPVKLKDENGKVFLIKAGYNGSLQGAQEAEWGYTVPCAADWDGDGDFDVIVNSVTGRVVWLENIGTATNPQLTQPQAIEVEWENGNLYPTWQWWVPEGNELVTGHRSTMYAIDFNSDGLCDLVGLDYQGYLVFYERYNEGGVLKLKQGARIFVDTNGKPIRLQDGIDGESGRRKLVITDWNCDGKLDLLVDGSNFDLYKTVKIEDGKYYMQNEGAVAVGTINGHNHGFTSVDWDGDGDPDIISGTESGYFYYFENPTK